MSRTKNSLGLTALFFFIITSAITVTILFFPLYAVTLWFHNIPEQLGISFDVLMENYFVLQRYLHFPWINELQLPDFASSVSGLFHFREVKQLFYINYAILFVSGISSFFYLRMLKRKKSVHSLVFPFKIAVWIPIAFLFFLAIRFDQFFTFFHEVFFNNDAWLFNPATDPIINALPQEFFMYCFILFFVLVEGALFFIYYYSKKTSNKEELSL